MEVEHLCLDNFGTDASQAEAVHLMIKRHNLIKRKCTDTNLNWLMEEIVFDFLCLEDDIIEDLCKDFPAESNYDRYTIAHSLDFDQRKLCALQSSQGFELPIEDFHAILKEEMSPLEIGDTTTAGNLSANVVTCDCGTGGTERDKIKSNQRMTFPRRQRHCHCPSDRNLIGSEDSGTKNCEPIILKYELLSGDVNGNEDDTKGVSDRMRIRIELLNLLESPVVDKGAPERNQPCECPSPSDSKTTKVKIRIPRYFINPDEEESLRNFVISQIKEQYNSKSY